MIVRENVVLQGGSEPTRLSIPNEDDKEEDNCYAAVICDPEEFFQRDLSNLFPIVEILASIARKVSATFPCGRSSQ